MLYQTTQAHEDLRAKVREFAEAEIKPIAFMLDKENRFPAEAVKKMGELGLMGLPYGTEYEGAGSDALSYAIAVEELKTSASPTSSASAPAGPTHPSATFSMSYSPTPRTANRPTP